MTHQTALTDEQLDEIDAWASKPLGPGPAAEQRYFAALVAEVRSHRAELERRTEDLASADNPTRLRWGLNDVLLGDDDTVTVLLSGPEREPYWLELESERAAVLRQDLAGPEGAADGEEAHPDRHRWYVEILDGNDWDLTSRFHTERDAAVRDIGRRNQAAPQWEDGRDVQRRLVRETTMHTVEEADDV